MFASFKDLELFVHAAIIHGMGGGGDTETLQFIEDELRRNGFRRARIVSASKHNLKVMRL